MNVPLSVLAPPNFAKLPAGFSFVAEAALLCYRFEYIFSEEVREQVPELISPDEKALLVSTADKLRVSGFSTLDQWYKALGLEHIEAQMVLRMIGVLDALDLPYH